MKSKTRGALVGALAFAVAAGIGVPAFAATTPTLVMSGGSAVFGLGSVAVNATAGAPGKVKFMANGEVITGCDAVATTTTSPYVAVCQWTPAKSGANALSGTLTPTDATAYTSVDSPVLNVKVGVPIQTTAGSPIQIYVDTILATGSTGALAPRFNGCAVMNEFLLGQNIVFRVYANNADQGNAVMDSTNTAKAYIEVAGLKDPIQMKYGNHSGVAFWTGLLRTGTATGQYSTLGTINYKVVMVAKDTDSVKVLATKRVARVVDGVRQVDANGNTIYDRVAYYRTVKVTPAVKGATGFFQPEWNANSKLTLFAVPVQK